MSIKKIAPWWLKIILKILISRIPVSYSFWKKLGVFEHGDMDLPQRSLDTFLNHARCAGVLREDGDGIAFKQWSENFTVLEIGPGDSLFSGVISHILGAERTWLVDAGNFARMDRKNFKSFLEYFGSRFGESEKLIALMKSKDILQTSNTHYLTNGTRSLSEIPDQSVDFCFSHAVLEHIPKQEFSDLARELKRILKDSAISSHRVDLQDHLGGGLNNLRFSEKIWESSFMRKSGFYTNRIRSQEMFEIFKEAGLMCNVSKITKWDNLPVERSKLHRDFRRFEIEELKISGFDVLLTNKGH